MSSKISSDLIRKLRDQTGAPVMRVKQVLEEVGGKEKLASEILKKEGFEKTAKRADRETSAGMVAVYSHHTGKVASIVELLCETDFVARNSLFIDLGNNLAMQIASMNPKDNDELLNQDYIKDPSQKVGDLIKEVIAKTGENIRLNRFERIEIGK